MHNVESTVSKQKSDVQGKKMRGTAWKKAVHAVAATTSKIDSFTITMRSLREMAEKEAKLVQCALKDMENNLIDPKHILELTKSIHGTGEKSISEYINRNTEILLNEHSSVIRQQVIENMKLQMKEMSDELTRNTQKLESNISNFFELIESSYHSAADSFNKVVNLAQEIYNSEELINETKDELFSLQGGVQKLEEQLLECLMCYAFLDSLVPSAQKGKKLELPNDFLKSFGPSFSPENRKLTHKKLLDSMISSEESFGPFEVHIESPDEIMKVIDRLKDSNLSLVHNSHLSKGAMKFEKKELDEIKEKMFEDLKSYDIKIAAVEKEIEKTKEMQAKLKKQLRFEDLKSYDIKIAAVEKEIEKTKEMQAKLKKQLREMQEDKTVKETLLQRENEMQKLAELYNLCTGSDVKNVDIFLMKAAIDYCLEDLFNELNKHPKRKIRDMIKVLEAKKKLAERKLEEALRAERLQKRLEKKASQRKIIL